jgi:Flp pilus assembly secretin CpaC
MEVRRMRAKALFGAMACLLIGVGMARGVDQQPSDREAAETLLQEKLAERERLQREIDELRSITHRAEQVLVKVQLAEINLTKLRQLGVDCSWIESGQIRSVDFAEWISADIQAPDNHEKPWVQNAPSTALSELLHALTQQNVARMLAEPTIVVVSGRPASLNVGGEIPLPSTDGRDVVGYRSYGTHLDLVADVLCDDRVRLQIRPRVCEIDTAHTITVGEHQVPALKVRQCDVTTDVALGKSTIISGCTEERVEIQIDESGQHETVHQVALLVVVTPELVK